MGGGGGEPPTPLPSFFPEGITPPTHVPGQQRGTPSPLRARPGDPRKSRRNRKTPPFTPEIPREIQDPAMQKSGHLRTRGGRGVSPLPPCLLFFRRGSPPHPCAGPAGGVPPPLFEVWSVWC